MLTCFSPDMAHITYIHNSSFRANHTAPPNGKRAEMGRLPEAWKESRGRY